MILTVTPNPSIDLLYEADRLVWDDANRVEMPRRRAGGQGINVTRAVQVLGGDSVALAFFGGAVGNELKGLLEADGTHYIDVPIHPETRTFVAVSERTTGRSLLVNPLGPILTEDDRAQLLVQVETACAHLKPEWVLCSGSLPRGIGNDVYAFIGKIAHAHGAHFIADCDGVSLELAVQHGCDLLAPNKHEAERLVRAPIVSVQDAAVAARSLLSAAPVVLVKLGAAGAVLADTTGVWHAKIDRELNGSAVGAGDSCLAGYLIANKSGAPPYEALRRAVAAGGAVLLSRDGALFTRADYDSLLPSVIVRPV